MNSSCKTEVLFSIWTQSIAEKQNKTQTTQTKQQHVCFGATCSKLSTQEKQFEIILVLNL